MAAWQKAEKQFSSCPGLLLDREVAFCRRKIRATAYNLGEDVDECPGRTQPRNVATLPAEHRQPAIHILGIQAFSGGLSHHLDEQDSRNHRETRKVIEEWLLIYRHGLEA